MPTNATDIELQSQTVWLLKHSSSGFSEESMTSMHMNSIGLSVSYVLFSEVLRIRASGQIFVLSEFTHPLSLNEIAVLQSLVENGGLVIVCVGARCAVDIRENINYFLEEYGMTVRNMLFLIQSLCKVHSDSTVDMREVCPTEGHPAETCVCRTIDGQQIRYAYGCSLVVNDGCCILATTGTSTYPINRPVVAITKPGPAGRVCLIGSSDFFTSDNLDFFNLIIDRSKSGEASSMSASDYRIMPDICSLASMPMPCFIPTFEHELNHKDVLSHLCGFKHVEDPTGIDKIVEDFVEGRFFSSKEWIRQRLESQSIASFLETQSAVKKASSPEVLLSELVQTLF